MVKKIAWYLIIIALFFLGCYFASISTMDTPSTLCGICCALCADFVATSVLDAKRKKKSAAPTEEVSGDA